MAKHTLHETNITVTFDDDAQWRTYWAGSTATEYVSRCETPEDVILKLKKQWGKRKGFELLSLSCYRSKLSNSRPQGVYFSNFVAKVDAEDADVTKDVVHVHAKGFTDALVEQKV